MNLETNDFTSLELIKAGGSSRDRGISLLYRAHARHLYRRFLQHCRNSEDAHDLVQDTFVNVVKNCESYRGDCPFKGWLWQVALNCLNDHFRRKKGTMSLDDWDAIGSDQDEAVNDGNYFERHPEKIHPDSPFKFVSDGNPTRENLEKCVDNAFRQFAKVQPTRAFALSLVVEGFDTAYIADAIQRNEGATREYLSQCRKKIEEFMRPCREYLATA